MNHYTYRAEWSAEHGEYVGRCIELSWLSRWAPTMQEAIAEACDGRFDAWYFRYVDAGANNHADSLAARPSEGNKNVILLAQWDASRNLQTRQ